MNGYIGVFRCSPVSWFLDGQARFMLSRLDERLNALERKMAYLESRIVTVVPN